MDATTFDSTIRYSTYVPPQRDRDLAAARRRLDALAVALDSAVRIPGTGIRVGADAALNIVPGIGTLVAKGLAAYLIIEARRLGVPPGTLLRMVGNLGIDAVLSAVPVLGWVGDVFFRANRRNMALLNAHLDRELDIRVERPAAGGHRR